MSRELGIRLYNLRKSRTSYSQREIAGLLHMERSTYTKYETGDAEPSLDTLRQLKEILHAEYEELMDITLTEAEIEDYTWAKGSRKSR